MDIPSLIAMLERHEGERNLPYTDAKGKITIGVGRNLSDDGISHDEAMTLLENDIDVVLADLETFPWWASLSDGRQCALADLRFNVGAEGFRLFRKLIHALSVQDFPSAAAEIRNSQIAPARRAELAQMMEHG